MEGNRYVISDQPSGDAPRLMLIAHDRLSDQATRNLRDSLSRVLDRDFGPIVIHGGFEVFQLIEGRWIRLDGSIELEDAPKPEKVNFREFL